MAKRHRKTPKQPKNNQQLVVYNPRATSFSNEVYSSELRKILRKYIDASIEQFIFSYLFIINNLFEMYLSRSVT
jgi:hypothetical protein